MEIIQGIRSFRPDEGSAVTVGFFDGVHVGHQAVIRRAVKAAKERDLRSVALTFDRHPREVLTPQVVPQLLTTLRRKAELIEALGVEVLAVMEFDEDVSRWEPERFVDQALVGGLGIRHAVVGANFTFGHKAAGTAEVLEELGRGRGFGVQTVPLTLLDGQPVSSTSIRRALAEGDLVWPSRALGRRYSVEGTVIPGAGRGKNLGFPTANLRTPARILLPGRGVYAGRAYAGGDAWTAAIDVGMNPTFGEEPLHVEAFLLDFEGDIQGSVLAVEFWERLRDEVRFESPEALALQMKEDVARTRALVPGKGTSTSV
ncbi:MAG TPA: bifunctional riboflavin kinase/FAD synthetase [Actinomycetota bacterium]|nr:bifunctional riboflavin kinase/FAD synthetase [Actinomycetota bacterium]